MAAFTVDYQDAQGLSGLLSKARQLTQLIEDIVMSAGSDAHHASLEFYSDVKSQAERNVPEAWPVYEQLKAASPRSGRRRRSTEGGEA
jgi:hypothetical protein